MNYNKWDKIYDEIVQDLGLDKGQDIRSAKLLEKKLSAYEHTKLVTVLKPFFYHQDIFIFGAGPSLEQTLLNNLNCIKKGNIIAADGATTALIKNNIKPDIIITDLDGYLPDQITANKKGSIVVVHAHGDNIKTIKNTIPKFTGTLLGSTQVNPADFKLLFNIGGFTDGDRAVYLADHFHAKTISLIGFDCQGPIGQYSFAEKKNKKRKKKKLKWCHQLIEKLNHKSIVYL